MRAHSFVSTPEAGWRIYIKHVRLQKISSDTVNWRESTRLPPLRPTPHIFVLTTHSPCDTLDVSPRNYFPFPPDLPRAAHNT